MLFRKRKVYRELESRVRQLRESERYEEARETLEKMIDLLKGNPAMLDEHEDRIRILETRKIMESITEERLYAGMKIAQLYREAASFVDAHHVWPHSAQDRWPGF